MRFKYYIRGFGFGLILATLVLSISFRGKIKELERANKYPTSSEKQTQSDATEELPLETQLESQMESESEIIQESQVESESEIIQESQVESESEIIQESQIESENETQQETQTTESESLVYVKITVENGDTCRMIGQKLLDNQLIEDVEDFRNYMSSHKWANDFRVGVYLIPVGATYDEIAKIMIPSYQ